MRCSLPNAWQVTAVAARATHEYGGTRRNITVLKTWNAGTGGSSSIDDHDDSTYLVTEKVKSQVMTNRGGQLWSVPNQTNMFGNQQTHLLSPHGARFRGTLSDSRLPPRRQLLHPGGGGGGSNNGHDKDQVNGGGGSHNSGGSDDNRQIKLSLDGTPQFNDLRTRRLTRSKSNMQHGMGGAFIRPTWESNVVGDAVTTNPTSAPTAEPKAMAATYLGSPQTVSVIGAPISWGQPLEGTDCGPKMIREAGLTSVLKKLGLRIHDRGDLLVTPPTQEETAKDQAYFAQTGGLARNAAALGRMLEALARKVEIAAKARDFVLTIGGDHSIALGSLAGILAVRPETGIIWVDAHADLNTPLTSETGNVHGMPVGMLMAPNEVRTIVPGFKWLHDHARLSPNKIVYIGPRDLDPAERKEIRSKNIKCFTMFDVDKYGIGEIVRRAVDHLGPSCPLHLSYDIDAIDPEVAPSTGTVVRGGFNYREAHFIAEAIAETGRLCSMDMVEINPSLSPAQGSSDATVQLGLAIVASALGSRIL